MEFDNDGLAKLLGHQGSRGVLDASVVRYMAGVIYRERERVAQALAGHVDEGILKAILSRDSDDKVFRFKGPESTLDRDGQSPLPWFRKIKVTV